MEEETVTIAVISVFLSHIHTPPPVNRKAMGGYWKLSEISPVVPTTVHVFALLSFSNSLNHPSLCSAQSHVWSEKGGAEEYGLDWIRRQNEHFISLTELCAVS